MKGHDPIRGSVLHVGDTAGVPRVLSLAQRGLGMKSDVIAFQHHKFGYEADFLRPTKTPFPFRCLERILSLSKLVDEYDILHFHYSSALPMGLDIPLWKRMGKKIVIHHKGDDIRGKGEGYLFSHLSDGIIVSTPDLLEWSEDAIWVPNPIDLDSCPPIGIPEHSGPLRIVHAPSDRRIKGTEHVIRAVDEIQKEGYYVELIMVENTPHEEARKLYMGADIMVDQLLVGWYGNFAIEAMALGKPVCAFIREDLASYLDGAPVINTGPIDLAAKLKSLVEDASWRRSLGRAGRSYVERRHRSDLVAKYIIKYIYNL
ncbi:MAG: hypothetical protein A4E45_02284 [Methanosaeta sp. PtaB.Bin039]|nr:MAG: hypothetical protein A4E45_02284 [Methanosaeta sp. PtaB.Bin039]